MQDLTLSVEVILNIDKISEYVKLIDEFHEISKEISSVNEEHYKHSKGNILDCLYLKEPDHSRILAGILNYYSNGMPEVLRSFIQMLSNKCESIEIAKNNLEKAEIKTEEEHIDCLISDNENYAIIIENKIYFAIDQEAQIERYIDWELKRINKENIFVVYLTKDGSKKVEEYSFTDKAKRNLDYMDSDNQGRYIEINYKDDILPWLEDIIGNIRNRDRLYLEFIDQYIDKLKGEFRLRDIDKGEDILMEEELDKVLEITGKSDKERLEKLTEVKKDLDVLFETLNKSIDSIMTPLFLNAFGKKVSSKFTNIIPNDKKANHYYQIFIGDLDHSFHFELMYDYDIPNIEKLDIYLHDETSEKKFKHRLEQDSDFNNLINSKGYTIGKGKVEVIHKEIKLGDKLVNVINTEIPEIVQKEYAIMNDIADYIIKKIEI